MDLPVFVVVQLSKIQPRLFSVDEYYRMAETGILHPDERVELIDGYIVTMPPQGPLHAGTVDKIASYLRAQIPLEEASVRDDKPIALGKYGEPVPDVAVVEPDSAGNYYSDRHPGPENVRLIVEVADSSLEYDLTTKKGLYARAGICEYWVVDTAARKLHRFTDPQGDGYCTTAVLDEGNSLTPVAFPALTILVAELLTRRR